MAYLINMYRMIGDGMYGSKDQRSNRIVSSNFHVIGCVNGLRLWNIFYVGQSGMDMLRRSRYMFNRSMLLSLAEFRYLSVSLTLVMITMPRSPVWLRSKNLNSEAEKSTEWLGLQTQTKIIESLHVIEKGRFV